MTDPVSTIYPLFLENPLISTDSRQVLPGSLFFALKGDNFNGNEFAAAALEKGARYAVVDDPACAAGDRFLLVDDVLTTLQKLAAYHREQFSIPVVGVTGTNGKTTTKELIYAVLRKKFRTVATRGNLNNHIGVPVTLLNLTRETEIALIEMGANHPGEIDFLCRIARPDFGLITNIGKAHLEGFGGFEGVIRTKTELYRFLRERDGTIFLNNGDSLLKSHAEGLKTIKYGEPPADVEATSIVSDPFVTLGIKLGDGKELTVRSKLYGRYNAANMLAAAAVGQYFGVPAGDILEAIETYEPDNNRSQVLQTRENLLILDAYNANPSSMEAALTTFAESGYPEKTVILGDMLELGADSDPEHQRILELAGSLGFSSVYLVGPVFTRINTRRENICFHDSELARMWLEHHPVRNSTVLIKGSRGIKLEKVVGTL